MTKQTVLRQESWNQGDGRFTITTFTNGHVLIETSETIAYFLSELEWEADDEPQWQVDKD